MITKTYDDIRFDLMGEFCPYVIYSGESADLMSPFSMYPVEDRAIEMAELMSAAKVPVKLFLEVRYLPDKKDINNKKVIWSKVLEPVKTKVKS